MKNKKEIDLNASDTGLTGEQIKDLGAVYTPMELVNKMLDSLDYDWNQDHRKSNKTFLDPTSGNGQFILGIAMRGVQPKNIYGVDIVPENIEHSKERLYPVFIKNGYTKEEIEDAFSRNLVVADALTYHYNFHEADEMDAW